MQTFDPHALECLAAVIEHGGFERAAQHLAITQSAVSQRVRALEAQVGTVLLVRSRPVKATAAGQLLLKHTQMLRLLRVDLEQDLRDLAPSHSPLRRGASERLSVAINADSIATILRMPSGCTPDPAGPSVPRITRESSPISRAVLRATRAARSFPL